MVCECVYESLYSSGLLEELVEGWFTVVCSRMINELRIIERKLEHVNLNPCSYGYANVAKWR